MADRPPEIRRRVTLEDLLRLKRAERPPPEFWAGFEAELRQRQLAALVERKSWWREAVTFARLRRLRVPFGALAVLGLTLLAMHRYTPPPGSGARPIEAPAPGPAVAATVPAAPARAEVVAVAPPVGVPAPVPALVAAPRPEETGAPAVAAVAAGTGDASRVIPWLGDIALDRLAAAGTAGDARPATVDLASVPAMVEPGLAAPAAPALGFEERAMPEMRRRPTADVLPTAAAAAVPRRARLLAVLDLGGASSLREPSAPEHVRRSAMRDLMQDDETRSMSRLDSEAPGLSLVRF